MKHKNGYGKYLLAAALGLASAASASAQLQLNGLTATFLSVVPPATGTIVNGPAVQTFTSSAASPSILLTNTLTSTPINFIVNSTTDFNTFSVIRSDKISSALSTFSSVNLRFDFDFAGGAPIDFSILYTYAKTFEDANIFSYSITPQIQSGNFVIGANNYTYQIVGDGVTGTVALGNSSSIGQASLNMDISFTAVPEPSTYALFGVAALGGMVALRRYRASRSAPVAQLTLA